MSLQPHQQRVVDEKAELDERLLNLSKFMGQDIFCCLPLGERSRLTNQQALMRALSDVLADRIANFESTY